MKKVRNVRCHTVLKDTLKTETSNFSLHWKPVECSQQCCCTCMPGLYKGQVGLHDLVCSEAYSVCCQGYQQEENYSSLT